MNPTNDSEISGVEPLTSAPIHDPYNLTGFRVTEVACSESELLAMAENLDAPSIPAPNRFWRWVLLIPGLAIIATAIYSIFFSPR